MSQIQVSLPFEIWMMVIDQLRGEESPQHIARLARTCKLFHKLVNHFLYQPVKFVKRQNALQFAALMRARPDLKLLVTEIRHYADGGFHNFTFCSDPFYKQLATLPNLHTLAMRPRKSYNRGTRLERWEDMLQRNCTFIMGVDWEDEVMEDMGKILNEDRGDPEDRLPMGPFDIDEGLFEPIVPTDEDDLLDRAQFCGGYLVGDSAPALRTCHIGDYGVPGHGELTVFNNSIMALSQLRTLCVTGATFGRIDYVDQDSRGHPSMPYLEELTLLNCDIDVEGFQILLSHTSILKRLTIRGGNELGELAVERMYSEHHGSLLLGKELGGLCGASLESFDLDLYGGTTYGMSLHGLRCLKSLTVTPYTIIRLDSELVPEFEDILPPSLEKLVLRHEEGEDLPLGHLFQSVKNKGLPNLDTITVRIPETIPTPEGSATPSIWTEAESWVDFSKEFCVALEVVRSPYPAKHPDYDDVPNFDLCSCEVLDAFHRREYIDPGIFIHRPPWDDHQDGEDSSDRFTHVVHQGPPIYF